MYTDNNKYQVTNMTIAIGIPVKLLHEGVGFVITIELKSGELFRGKLIECQDNFNCRLEAVTHTDRVGKLTKMEHTYLRGSKIRMVVLPDMLKNSPLFRKMDKAMAAVKSKAGRDVAAENALTNARGRGGGRGGGGRGGFRGRGGR